jgi:hypothetical protein
MQSAAMPRRADCAFIDQSSVPRMRGAARADGMAERDRAAIHVDLRRVELESANAGDRLRCERFVELDEIEVGHFPLRSVERFLARGNRPLAHEAWIDAAVAN